MSFWKNKKVLVTGASGFIGSHLVEELAGLGASVTAMVHYNSRNNWGNIELLDQQVKDSIDVINGDIRDPYFCLKAVEGKSFVFHLAAHIAIPYSYIAPAEFVQTNVIGTLNMLQAARQVDFERFVHTSTSESYGTARYVPIDEKHPMQSQSLYSASKIGADKIAESYYLSFGTPVATLRPFNTFGPRQSARAVIPAIISQLVHGTRQLKLGSLSPERDFTFVKDTVAGFLKTAESDKTLGEVINIGSGKCISIGQLAEMLIELTGSESEIVCDEGRIRPKKGEVLKLQCCWDKAKDLIGWEPKYSLEQGLLETIEFIRSNKQRYKPEIHNV